MATNATIDLETADAPTLVWPHAPRWGECFDLEITAIDAKGRGVGMLDLRIGPQELPRRYEVTVRATVPGDRVRVAVGKPRKRRVEGRLEALLRPAPERVEPPCPHFGSSAGDGRGCGGCSLQTLPYEAQIALKRAQVVRALTPAGVSPTIIASTVAAESPWLYRNKMEFSFGDDDQRRATIGMHPAGFRYEVMDLLHCRLESDEAMVLVAAARAHRLARGLQHHDQRRDRGWLRTLTIREGKRTGERMVEITTAARQRVETSDGETTPEAEIAAFSQALQVAASAAGVSIDSLWWSVHDAQRGRPTEVRTTLLSGTPYLRERLHVPGAKPLLFHIHPRAFFQPNTWQAEVLYELALRALGPQGTSAHVLDLYCGTGTIGLCLAQGVGRVTGIELSAEAVANANANALRNGIENVRFLCGDVATVLVAEGLDAPGAADAVIVDPPRAGLMPGALSALLQLAVRRLVYVSCNPKALGRDLVALQAGGYRVDSVVPVDHFPQTAHVETVVRLTRAGAEA